MTKGVEEGGTRKPYEEDSDVVVEKGKREK